MDLPKLQIHIPEQSEKLHPLRSIRALPDDYDKMRTAVGESDWGLKGWYDGFLSHNKWIYSSPEIEITDKDGTVSFAKVSHSQSEYNVILPSTRWQEFHRVNRSVFGNNAASEHASKFLQALFNTNEEPHKILYNIGNCSSHLVSEPVKKVEWRVPGLYIGFEEIGLGSILHPILYKQEGVFHIDFQLQKPT